MKKITKIGLSAMVAFVLMFATSASVVAQEKAIVADNMGMKESVEGKVSHAKSVDTKTASKTLNQTWHFIGGLGDLPTNAEKYQSGSADECPSGTDTVCELIAPVTGAGNRTWKLR